MSSPCRNYGFRLISRTFLREIALSCSVSYRCPRGSQRTFSQWTRKKRDSPPFRQSRVTGEENNATTSSPRISPARASQQSYPVRIGKLIPPTDLINVRLTDFSRRRGRLKQPVVQRLADTLRPTLNPEQYQASSQRDRPSDIIAFSIKQNKEALMEDNKVYTNPICLETDQLLFSCNEVDDVLTCLISHRGTFYLHNMITALQMLAILSLKATPAQHTQLLSDDRFYLLLSDLREQRHNLDLIAIVNILVSLRTLNIKQYLVCNALLEPLYKQLPVRCTSYDTLAQLVRIMQVYRWCGYNDAHYYSRCTDALVSMRTFPSISTAKHLPAASLSSSFLVQEHAMLVRLCRVFASLSTHLTRFFTTAQTWLLDPSSSLTLVPPQSTSWTPGHVARLCHAFTYHQQRNIYTPVISALHDHLAYHFNDYTVREMTTCIIAFKNAYLFFPDTVQRVAQHLVPRVQHAVLLRQTRVPDLSVQRLSILMDTLVFFPLHRCPAVRPLLHVCALYFERCIDQITERAAFRMAWSLAVSRLTEEHSYILSYLYRKVGRIKTWEKESVRYFQLWIAHELQFPHIEYNLPPTAVYEAYRAWCFSRGGFQSPFPDTVKEISQCLQDLGIPHTANYSLDLPYILDIAFEIARRGFIVTTHCTEDDPPVPVGVTNLELVHLRGAGWICHAISHRYWKTVLDTVEKKHSFLKSLVEAEVVPTSYGA